MSGSLHPHYEPLSSMLLLLFFSKEIHLFFSLSFLSPSVMLVTVNLFCLIHCVVSIDTRPPPIDPMESATEFSNTHFSRDSDLISLEIKAHK